MSALTVALLILGVPYFCWLTYRVLKLVWNQGAIGEVVTGGDVADMVLSDVWKVLTLPAVIWKALRKS